MRSLLAIVIVTVVTIAFAFGSCKSGGSPTFCDTSCMKDTLKFMEANHPLRPYVYITAKDCLPDTLMWSYDGMGVNRKLDLPDLVGGPVHLNRDFVRCVFNDTSYAWLLFNNCDGGRGYYLKIPFNKTKPIGRSARAINNFDKKFSVPDDLVSYIDPGNIFVEDMKTGETAMMTFGKDVQPDYANIHKTIDSVNITRERIWVKVNIDNEWKVLEKKIQMK
jgi:hypothetical protein